MVRILEPGKLVIASHNPGKIKEINSLLASHQVIAVSVAEFAPIAPEETENTFIGNARIKAKAAAEASGLPALSDDSGLEVAALDGAPGVYSADWAGEPRNFEMAMASVLEALQAAGTDDFSARFVCVLCLYWPDGHEEVFEGELRGDLVFPGRGKGGFGYDPIFRPDGRNETFGEMAAAEKRALSHRADALRKLSNGCFKSSGE